MKNTAVVMDSTGYLTSDILHKCDIKVVSLNINIGEETFREVDITNKFFFDKLSKISGTSTTSQPSPGSFIDVYKELYSQGYKEIVSIHLSEKISGTYATAQMVKDLFKEIPVYPYDSGSSALGLGLLAWAAADLAERGLNASEIITELNELKKQTKLYFLVDTLEYLHRGGRIGGAAALFGTLLQIKPILHFNSEGIIDVFEKVRSKSRALQRILSELDKALATNVPHRIAVIHVDALEEAEEIKENLQKKYSSIHDIRIFEAGPVIATHVGPKALGLGFHPWPNNL